MLALALKGVGRRLETERKDRVWLAWSTASLGRMDKMPSLEAMYGEVTPKAAPRQSWQDQERAMLAWTVNRGGKVVRAEG